jgi:O-antigen/teichoic acid export membrane protein
MTGLLLLVGTFTMQEKSLLLILTIVQNISIITETLALKNGFDKKVLLSNIFFSVGFLICHLATLYHGYSLQLLLGGLVLIFMIKSIFVINRNFKLSASESADADISMAGRQWFYLGINDILGVLATWLDKWLILIFLTLTQFAIYFNGAYEVPLFGLMLGAVGNIMMIELAKKEGNDAGKIKLIFEKSSLFLASFVFPGFCFLLFYHAPFFMLIFGEKYIESIPVFFVSIFILPARTIYSTAVLQVYGKSNLIVKGAVLDILLAVILMLLLYPYFKMPGLALAFVLSSYFQLAFYLWQTSRLINKKITYFIPYKELSIKFIISFIIMLTGYFSFNYLAGNKSLITGIILSGAIAGFFFVYDLKKNRKNIQE